MRASRFSNEQIVQTLRQAESGTPVVDICRKLGITETTLLPLEEAIGDLAGWLPQRLATFWHARHLPLTPAVATLP